MRRPLEVMQAEALHGPAVVPTANPCAQEANTSLSRRVIAIGSGKVASELASVAPHSSSRAPHPREGLADLGEDDWVRLV
eukprot:UN2839